METIEGRSDTLQMLELYKTSSPKGDGNVVLRLGGVRNAFTKPLPRKGMETPRALGFFPQEKQIR
jgi:hypothetical protein